MLNRIRAIFKVKQAIENLSDEQKETLKKGLAVTAYYKYQIDAGNELRELVLKQQAELERLKKEAGL